MKNKLLLVLFLALIAANYLLRTLDFSTGNSLDETQFALSDTSQISKIRLISKDTVVTLSKRDGIWMVNDTWPVERSWEVNIKAVLERHRIRREILGAEKQVILDELAKTGVKVEVLGGEEILLSFVAGGNPTRTRSVITAGGYLYEMFVPGYEAYLSSIYQLGPYEWRDRTLYNGNERTMRSLFVRAFDPAKAVNLLVDFTQDRPRSPQFPELSLDAWDSYLESLNGLFADVWVPSAEQDKVKPYLRDPIVELELEDMLPERSLKVRFYNLPDETRFYLGEIIGNEDYFLISMPRLERILAGPKK
jgi:hypothetical protein